MNKDRLQYRTKYRLFFIKIYAKADIYWIQYIDYYIKQIQKYFYNYSITACAQIRYI